MLNAVLVSLTDPIMPEPQGSLKLDRLTLKALSRRECSVLDCQLWKGPTEMGKLVQSNPAVVGEGRLEAGQPYGSGSGGGP